MIKIQPFGNKEGFGDEGKYAFGQYFFSQGMSKYQDSLIPGWLVASQVDDGTLSGLGLTRWFTQGTPIVGGNMQVFSTDDNGKIYQSIDGTGTPTLAHTSAQVTSGNGLIVNQLGELFYLQSRYLGKYDGATWTDNFQDFGASSLADNADYRPADLYEDLVVMGNGKNIATYNVSTLTFAPQAFTLPSRFKSRCIKSGRNGILTGANIDNLGALILWDGNSDRSIAPWTWENGTIQTIARYGGNWIVISDKRIFIHNGYSVVEELPNIPDSLISVSAGFTYYNVLPQGADVVGNYLVVANTIGDVTRARTGYWILNLKNPSAGWEFTPVANYCMSGVSLGALFVDSNTRIHTGYTTTLPSKKNLALIRNLAPAKSFFISEPVGQTTSKKIAKAIRINLGLNTRETTAAATFGFTLAIKVYDYKRQLWQKATQKTTGSSLTQITVDGTISGQNEAQVGDEVQILSGGNAGTTAHITAISGQQSATEVWTIDTTLTNNMETNAVMVVSPFRLVRKKTFSSLTKLLEDDLFFDIKNKYKAQKYLIKVLFEGVGQPTPALLGGDFIYEDLSVL
jgi:hypothetical protein